MNDDIVFGEGNFVKMPVGKFAGEGDEGERYYGVGRMISTAFIGNKFVASDEDREDALVKSGVREWKLLHSGSKVRFVILNRELGGIITTCGEMARIGV